MRFYNSHGMFCNYGDTAEGLKKGLLAHFDEVDVRIVGRLGLFMAKKPVSLCTLSIKLTSDMSIA